MSLDTIKFKIKEHDYFFDIQVFLNNVLLPHEIFNLDDFYYHYKEESSEFDLFTCSCGVAGCAGFYEGIEQKRNAKTVIWTFPEENYYITTKKTYIFDTLQFDNAVDYLNTEIVKMFTINKYFSQESF